jgi:uncharacterized protein (TIGR03089 family)
VKAPSVPADLLTSAVGRNPAAPLVTWYDDGTGDRVELSATTLANWVAKAANLLQDEFDVAPGSAVAVALPVHWQTVLLAVWSCGATVLDAPAEDDGHLADVDLVMTTQDRIVAVEEAGGEDGPDIVGLSLHPMGLGMSGYAGSARDFALEVRAQADVFVPWSPADPDSPGLRAGELGRRRDRVLVDTQTAAEAGPVAWLLAPLTAGASLVLCRDADPAALPGRVAAERITATLGPPVDGVRALGRPG